MLKCFEDLIDLFKNAANISIDISDLKFGVRDLEFAVKSTKRVLGGLSTKLPITRDFYPAASNTWESSSIISILARSTSGM